LCVSAIDRLSQCLRQLVQPHLVRVLLRRIRMPMAHEGLERDGIAAALAKEAIREAVSQLMRGEGPNPGALADAPDHPHQRLIARRPLWILPPARSSVVGNPLLDLHGENVVVRLGPECLEALTQLGQHIGRDRHPLPMAALPPYVNPTQNQIDIDPAATDDL
jgi:hypothetical protein